METNLTFKQRLIFMMAEKSVGKFGIHELTDGTISTIKYIANKLSEGIREEQPETRTNKYPPFETEMHKNTVYALKLRGVNTPEELIEHDFEYKCLRGMIPNIELLQYAMNHNIKLKNFHYK